MKAPFPWFGGKRRVAHIVWERFGDVYNYVEPFAGSLAVLLERPHAPRCETVNDKDCFIANFWRALQNNPDELAFWSDHPVNEADLHARHTWLTGREDFRRRMMQDPEYFDVKIAGWWVWGLSMWIGGGWCSEKSQSKTPHISRGWKGVNQKDHWQERPALMRGDGMGVHNAEHWKKRPLMKRGGVGVQRTQLPDLSGDSGAYGKGVHACGLDAKTGGLQQYFQALAARLRRVRVCCGDWARILGPSPTYLVGVTAVFLDPPYSDLAGRDKDLYSEDCLQVAKDVAQWARDNGDNPLLRIALCGYAGEHEMPDGWACIHWKTNGGYSNQSKKRNDNSTKERIWFSPHCLEPNQADLFT